MKTLLTILLAFVSLVATSQNYVVVRADSFEEAVQKAGFPENTLDITSEYTAQSLSYGKFIDQYDKKPGQSYGFYDATARDLMPAQDREPVFTELWTKKTKPNKNTRYSFEENDQTGTPLKWAKAVNKGEEVAKYNRFYGICNIYIYGTDERVAKWECPELYIYGFYFFF